MQRTSSFSRSKRVAMAALILACGAVWSAPASVEPPPWAPAWGYRAKHKGKNKHRVQQAYHRTAALPDEPFGDERAADDVAAHRHLADAPQHAEDDIELPELGHECHQH